MKIPRIITIEQLNERHKITRDALEYTIDNLYNNLKSMDNVNWRGNLRSAEVLARIGVIADGIVSDVVDVNCCQRELKRLNRKRQELQKKARG